jgi:hypothetical protein
VHMTSSFSRKQVKAFFISETTGIKANSSNKKGKLPISVIPRPEVIVNSIDHKDIKWTRISDTVVRRLPDTPYNTT